METKKINTMNVIKILYDYDKDVFTYETNIKKELLKDILLDFLRLQIGAGEDLSKPNITNLYTINIYVELQSDTFTSNHNCGNLGLRDGLIMHFIEKEFKK